MSLNFRFAVISDLHIALPDTITDHPSRFHMVEVSIPALEIVLRHLEQLNLDFLLIPGDLTQDGEPENHAWLQKRLLKLPFPVYVVPGNHDVPSLLPTDSAIGLQEFPRYYQQFGYEHPEQLYYTTQILPGVRLIGLNSNNFSDRGKQIGRLDDAQLAWLQQHLKEVDDELVMVMVHHNVVEHLPGQSTHQLGRRYMLENAPVLLQMLREAGVNLIFTGHLHIQDIACDRGVYEITTGSLVSYPHPYRILNFRTDKQGKKSLQIESHRVESVPHFPTLPQFSRDWMGDRSLPFMLKLLTEPPLNIPMTEAEGLAPNLRYFWADVAKGDVLFDFSHFPPVAKRYFESFGAIAPDGTPALIDNYTTLSL
ncbi:metallophosphoesterase [Trichocoleus sp. DQ-U1]|uniref:metallophosphoesterase family protein n=1 Tax=Trichocoleus sp. DQ-U1 TaxID=2933926 RepID=UPI003296CFD7